MIILRDHVHVTEEIKKVSPLHVRPQVLFCIICDQSFIYKHQFRFRHFDMSYNPSMMAPTLKMPNKITVGKDE